MNPLALTPASENQNFNVRLPKRLTRLGSGLLGAVIAFAALSSRADETWQLNNLADVSGHKVTVLGAPRVAEVAGGKTLVFDGAHDGIFMPAIPIAGDRAFTIEVLFSPAEGGNEAQRFFHVQDEAGRRALMEIGTNAKGGWWLDAFMMTDPGKANSGLALIDPKRVHATDRWYWVAMRYDGKHMADFVNGVKELEGEHTFAPIGQGKISIGVRQNLVYWFKGAIREVRFHDEALPDARLQRVKE